MDNSQTSATDNPGKPKGDKTNDHADRSSDSYYYDDATGYEIYEEEDDKDDEAEEGSSSNERTYSPKLAILFEGKAPVCRSAS